MPSGTTVPASLRPFQLVVAAAPLPPIVLTVVPAAFPMRSCQWVAPPPAARENPTVSRIPSPFGEISGVVAAADEIVGGTVSIVIPNAASWTAVTGRTEGAR